MPAWKAVVFDLDDTLYPERAYVLSGFRCVAAWMADVCAVPAEQGYGEFVRLFEAGVRGDTFNRWLEHFGLPQAHAAEMVSVYREHCPNLQPFAGINDLIMRLAPTSRLGLVSDGYLEVQQRKWSALPFTSAFDAVVFSDQWGREHWKPSHVPFTAVAQELSHAPGELVYVADNPQKDFIGARQLGMATVWARHSRGDYAVLTPPTPAHAPDFVTETVDGLAKLLLKY